MTVKSRISWVVSATLSFAYLIDGNITNANIFIAASIIILAIGNK